MLPVAIRVARCPHLLVDVNDPEKNGTKCRHGALPWLFMNTLRRRLGRRRAIPQQASSFDDFANTWT